MRWAKKCPDCGHLYKSKREDEAKPVRCNVCQRACNLSFKLRSQLREDAIAAGANYQEPMAVAEVPTFHERVMKIIAEAVYDQTQVKDLKREVEAAWSQVDELLAERKIRNTPISTPKKQCEIEGCTENIHWYGDGTRCTAHL